MSQDFDNRYGYRLKVFDSPPFAMTLVHKQLLSWPKKTASGVVLLASMIVGNQSSAGDLVSIDLVDWTTGQAPAEQLDVVAAETPVLESQFTPEPPPAEYVRPIEYCERCFQKEDLEIETFRRSVYQGTQFLGAFFGDTGDTAGGLDVTYEEVRASFAVPIDGLDHYVGIRPFFRATHLNGPSVVDVPETVYNVGVTFLHQKEWSPDWSTTVVISPSVRSDFSTSSDTVRVLGLAVLNWQYSRTLELSFGAAFLDREDVGLLPAFGFVWDARPDLRVNFIVPRPRVAKRLWKDGKNAEGWAYIGGGLGGNTWTVTRDDQSIDDFSLRDFQLSGGYEVIRSGNRGFYIEGGYAFDRTIEYERSNIEIDLDDALFIQGSWRF